jgi:hypothetical protein
MILGVLAQLVDRRAMSEDVVTELVRAVIGAPRQRAARREVDAGGAPRWYIPSMLRLLKRTVTPSVSQSP